MYILHVGYAILENSLHYVDYVDSSVGRAPARQSGGRRFKFRSVGRAPARQSGGLVLLFLCSSKCIFKMLQLLISYLPSISTVTTRSLHIIFLITYRQWRSLGALLRTRSRSVVNKICYGRQRIFGTH